MRASLRESSALLKRSALRTREEKDEAEALEADTERLRAIEIELDVCWDLLRQRRALRDAGANPDQAAARDPSTVERYWQ